MRQFLAALGLLSVFGTAAAGNFATCVLDEVPGIENDAAAIAQWQACLSKYPGGLDGVSQGSGRGIFGYDSGAECAAKKAAKTRSQRAGIIIRAACNRLYDEPNFFDKFDRQN